MNIYTHIFCFHNIYNLDNFHNAPHPPYTCMHYIYSVHTHIPTANMQPAHTSSQQNCSIILAKRVSSIYIIKKINVFIWLPAHVLHDVSFLSVVLGPRLPNFLKKWAGRASLLAQWLRICLPMQETWVRSLIQEDPIGHEATAPVCHNFWACALEPASCACWATCLRCWSLRTLGPVLHHKRSPHDEKPTLRNGRKTCATAKTQHSQK